VGAASAKHALAARKWRLVEVSSKSRDSDKSKNSAATTWKQLVSLVSDGVEAGKMWAHTNQALLHSVAVTTPALSGLIASGAITSLVNVVAAKMASGGGFIIGKIESTGGDVPESETIDLMPSDIYSNSIQELIDISEATHFVNLELSSDVTPDKVVDAIEQMGSLNTSKKVELRSSDGKTVIVRREVDGNINFYQSGSSGLSAGDAKGVVEGLSSRAIKDGRKLSVYHAGIGVMTIDSEGQHVEIDLLAKAGRDTVLGVIDHVTSEISRKSILKAWTLDIVRPEGAVAIDRRISDMAMGIFDGTSPFASILEVSSAGRELARYRSDMDASGGVDYVQGEHFGVRVDAVGRKMTVAAREVMVRRNAELMAHVTGRSAESLRFIFDQTMELAEKNSYHGRRPYEGFVLRTVEWDRAMGNMIRYANGGNMQTLTRVVDVVKDQSFSAGMRQQASATMAQKQNSADFVLGLAHEEHVNIMDEVVQLFQAPTGKNISITGSGVGVILRVRDADPRVYSGARTENNFIREFKNALSINPEYKEGEFYIIPETFTARRQTTPDFVFMSGSTAVYLEAKASLDGVAAGRQAKKGIRQLIETRVAPEVDALAKSDGKTVSGRFVVLDVTRGGGSYQGINAAVEGAFQDVESELRRQDKSLAQIAEDLKAVKSVRVLVAFGNQLWSVHFDKDQNGYVAELLHSTMVRGATKRQAFYHALDAR